MAMTEQEALAEAKRLYGADAVVRSGAGECKIGLDRVYVPRLLWRRDIDWLGSSDTFESALLAAALTVSERGRR